VMSEPLDAADKVVGVELNVLGFHVRAIRSLGEGGLWFSLTGPTQDRRASARCGPVRRALRPARA
jgi:hypothetical protein